MHYFTWKIELVSNILGMIISENLFASDSLKTPSNLIWLKILVTLKPVAQFQPKIRELKLEKKAKNLLYLVTAFPIFSLRFKVGIKRLSSFF